MTEKKYKNKFYMLVGLPGSGKTSVAMNLLGKTGNTEKTVWISSDQIRKELFGDESVQEDARRVFDLMRVRTLAALRAGKNVIYDACNINSKHRRSFLQNLKKLDCEKVCVVIATPYTMCVERNANRNRVVPVEVIKRMYRNWNTPAWFEGWDRMELIFADGTKGSSGLPYEFVMNLQDYDQMNPHHKETLGIHMKNTWIIIISKGYSEVSNIALAAVLHDCGKPFTREIQQTQEGEIEAHYYQHNCVGAYDALFFNYPQKTDEDIFEISLLINLHMSPFSWKNSGNCNERLCNLWGKKLYDEVLLIHEADQAASISYV